MMLMKNDEVKDGEENFQRIRLELYQYEPTKPNKILNNVELDKKQGNVVRHFAYFLGRDFLLGK